MVAARLRFFLLCLAVPIALATAYAVALEFTKHRFHEFPGVAGPPGVTVVARKTRTSWQSYGEGSTGRLAVLLTESDSSWLGLAHALKSFGVPFRITTSVAEALKHKVVLVYPIVSGKVLSQDELKALASFPRQGGHLIGVKVLGGGMNEVFGFTDTLSSRRRFDIRLDPTSSPVLADFTEEREQAIQLGDPDRFAEIVGTFGYSEPRRTLAVYGDGSAAIIERAYAEGRAYAFGFDIGDYFFRGHHARHHRAHRSYVNAFEPAGDVLARLIKKIYLRGNPDAATLGTVPEGRDLSVVFSYDVDAEESYGIMLDYAEFLRSAGIRGTFFIQTKYVDDYNDIILFGDEAVGYVKRLVELGMEVASHTVAHANAFSGFPLGDGDEHYPDYRPIVVDFDSARGGTVLGELRVSKFLLERLGGAPPIVSFRPGYLSYPNTLPQALEAGGYRFSSSMSANKALTHLPFQLNYDREAGQEVAIFEFPVTVEDEMPPKMGARVEDAIALARKIGRYGGSFVILTHPNELGHKLAFHRAFLAAVKDRAWFGSLSDFGEWWAARNAVELDSSCTGSGLRCTVRLRAPRRIAGLAVTLPERCRYQAEGKAGVRPTRSGVVFDEVVGRVEITCLRRSSAPTVAESTTPSGAGTGSTDPP
jgi:peptidoglycan/xylan/chitin deacetylase (PgdA/CDA1 family)